MTWIINAECDQNTCKFTTLQHGLYFSSMSLSSLANFFGVTDLVMAIGQEQILSHEDNIF